MRAAKKQKQKQASGETVQAGSSNLEQLTSGATRRFTSETRDRAGFNGIKITKVLETEDYFAFELSEKCSVRVGRLGTRYGTPHCTCQWYKHGIPCHHISWLIERVAVYISLEPRVITSDGSQLEGVPLYQRIQECGLENLAWQIDTDARRRVTQQELDRLRDFLSLYVPDRANYSVIGEGDQDVYTHAYVAHTETLIELATDVGIYAALEKDIPFELCAKICFKRLSLQVDQAFDRFESDNDISKAAATIQEICVRMEAEYKKWNIRGIPDIAYSAVAALTTVLSRICQPAGDLYHQAIKDDDTSVLFFILRSLLSMPREVLLSCQKEITEAVHGLMNDARPAIYDALEEFEYVSGGES